MSLRTVGLDLRQEHQRFLDELGRQKPETMSASDVNVPGVNASIEVVGIIETMEHHPQFGTIITIKQEDDSKMVFSSDQVNGRGLKKAMHAKFALKPATIKVGNRPDFSLNSYEVINLSEAKISGATPNDGSVGPT